MSKSLKDALEGNGWSVSKVVFDLHDVLDDEGRPISERRADAVARAGVEMEMKECPFSGIRKGRLMNVSALTQIANHYNPVMEEIAALRKALGGDNAAWADILAVVLDQLASPAIHLLNTRDANGRVPAQSAVGHKLAEGIFGVMRSVHERIAQGLDMPVTAAMFIEVMDETGALVGATEACAGSPQMIRKTVIALVEGGDGDVALAQSRLDAARCMAEQFQLGVFWRLYDRLHLWELLKGETRRHMVPHSEFLSRKLDAATAELGKKPPAAFDVSRLPDSLAPDVRARLSNALQSEVEPQLLLEDMQEALRQLGEPGAAIRFEGKAEEFSTRLAHYLNVRRQFEMQLVELEGRLRQLLGYSEEEPICLGSEFFPRPQALFWYEMVVGRKMGEDGHLSGKSTGVRVQALSPDMFPVS